MKITIEKLSNGFIYENEKGKAFVPKIEDVFQEILWQFEQRSVHMNVDTLFGKVSIQRTLDKVSKTTPLAEAE